MTETNPHFHDYDDQQQCIHCRQFAFQETLLDDGPGASPSQLESMFQRALDQLMAMEGGLVDNPNDPGGITKCGVSLRFIQGHNIDIDDNGTVEPEDIRALRTDQARDIYRKYWWQTAGGNPVDENFRAIGLMHLPNIALLCFQFAANIGYNPTVKCLQRALNAFNQKRSLADDGILGPNTVRALKAVWRGEHEDELIVAHLLRSEIAAHYRLIAAHNRQMGRMYLEGWLNRAYELGWQIPDRHADLYEAAQREREGTAQ